MKYILNKKKGLLIAIALLINTLAIAQYNKLIDDIVAVVGNNPILRSHVQNQLQQFKTQGAISKTECEVLEELLFQKMLVHQGQLDSTEVSDKQVEQELDRRIRYYIMQFGSEDELEKFYGKSVIAIKDDFRDLIKDQLLAQTVQGKIAGNITVSPAEIKEYYNSIPKDSIPFINSELEIAQLVKQPPISTEEKVYVKEKLATLRKRIVNGEDFASLAVLYSEDPGSAAKGGELGFLGKGQLVPEFEAAAFELKGKEVSKIIETQFGYHIIQLIERRGEMINVRHILLIPKISNSDLYKTSLKIDSIYGLLKIDSIKFDAAVVKWSDDKESKYSGGLLVNPASGGTRFEPSELDQQLFFTIDKLKVGEFTKPLPYQTQDNKQAYRILYLKTKTDPHKANLKDDYQRLQAITTAEKQNKKINDWINKKRKTVYIKIAEDYKSCVFKHQFTN